MKRISIFLTLIVIVSSYGWSQMHTVDKLFLPATGKQIGFYVDMTKSKYIFYDLETENQQQEARARINSFNTEGLILALQKAKDKYEKWSKIAHEEGSLSVKKHIPVIFRDQTIYFTDDNNWYCEKGVDMHADFYVDENNSCYLILQSDYMTSKEIVASISPAGSWHRNDVTVGHYCSGASLIFSSSDEITTFIEKLRAADDWKKQHKKQKAKFK